MELIQILWPPQGISWSSLTCRCWPLCFLPHQWKTLGS